MLTRRRPHRRARRLASALALTLLAGAGFANQAQAQTPSGAEDNPVLIVHGWTALNSERCTAAGRAAVLAPGEAMAADLRQRGFEATAVDIIPCAGTALTRFDLQQEAAALHRHVMAATNDGQGKVHLVGHSRGGMVIRWYAKSFQVEAGGSTIPGAWWVDTLTTVGTSNQGQPNGPGHCLFTGPDEMTWWGTTRWAPGNDCALKKGPATNTGATRAGHHADYRFVGFYGRAACVAGELNLGGDLTDSYDMCRSSLPMQRLNTGDDTPYNDFDGDRIQEGEDDGLFYTALWTQGTAANPDIDVPYRHTTSGLLPETFLDGTACFAKLDHDGVHEHVDELADPRIQNLVVSSLRRTCGGSELTLNELYPLHLLKP